MPSDGDKFHNALGGSAADQLRGYVRRVEALEDDITGLNNDKSEIYSEVKAAGFDKATMRKLVQRRRKNRGELEEADQLLELYESVLAEPIEPDPFD